MRSKFDKGPEGLTDGTNAILGNVAILHKAVRPDFDSISGGGESTKAGVPVSSLKDFIAEKGGFKGIAKKAGKKVLKRGIRKAAGNILSNLGNGGSGSNNGAFFNRTVRISAPDPLETPRQAPFASSMSEKDVQEIGSLVDAILEARVAREAQADQLRMEVV